jgi:hypothetical protein
MKSSAAQSEILIAILFLGLVSGAVIAQNATNITNFTGDFLANISISDASHQQIPLSGGESGNVTRVPSAAQTITVEATDTIEIWANTAIELPLERTAFYDNETLELEITLFLDNGDVIPDAEIEFYLDGNLIGSNSTDLYGQANLNLPLGGLSGSHALSVVFNGRDFMNPSEEQADIEVIPAGAEEVYEAQGEISYDPETDTITMVGNGERCTAEAPCTLSDIYDTDRENNWSRIENYGTFFIVRSGIRIGDGLNETWFVSSFEHIKILRPWEVMPLASLQFGLFSDEQGGYGYGGPMIDANVPEQDQLEHSSAIKVNAGGRLAMYETKYKVFSAAENNIYLHDDSSFEGWRFDIERVSKEQPQTPDVQATRGLGIEMLSKEQPQTLDVQAPVPTTTLRLPKNAVVMHALEREGIIYECADASLCQAMEVRA